MMNPCTLVIFGVTGNLARRKLIPALYQLEAAGRLPEGMVILGYGRREWQRQEWQNEVMQMLREKYPKGYNETAFERFLQRLHFFSGDLHNDEAIKALGRALDENPTFPPNTIFYLAVKPVEVSKKRVRFGSG